jgi:hypothetical protein
MAKISRNVTIRPAIINGNNIIIKGNQGGEMTFSLSARSMSMTSKARNKRRPLAANCYRTARIGYIDVTDYNGNKGETIKVIMNDRKKLVCARPMLYLFNPDNGIIEYGRLKRQNRRRARETLHYETKIDHEFNEVRIVCLENLCMQ